MFCMGCHLPQVLDFPLEDMTKYDKFKAADWVVMRGDFGKYIGNAEGMHCC